MPLHPGPLPPVLHGVPAIMAALPPFDKEAMAKGDIIGAYVQEPSLLVRAFVRISLVRRNRQVSIRLPLPLSYVRTFVHSSIWRGKALRTYLGLIRYSSVRVRFLARYIAAVVENTTLYIALRCRRTYAQWELR